MFLYITEMLSLLRKLSNGPESQCETCNNVFPCTGAMFYTTTIYTQKVIRILEILCIDKYFVKMNKITVTMSLYNETSTTRVVYYCCFGCQIRVQAYRLIM